MSFDAQFSRGDIHALEDTENTWRMAWVKIDDQAPRNAKLLKAGPAAAWLWVCGIAYGQSHLTEGFIPDLAIPMIGVTGAARARRLADTLVGVGLFERVEGGYQVHDYLAFNETKEEALARKLTLAAKRRAAGKAGGIASGEARSNEAKRKQTIEAKRSPDPTRPIKDPPIAPQGGRVTRKERQHAEEVRTRVHGGCPHSPRCSSRAECVEAIALAARERPHSEVH